MKKIYVKPEAFSVAFAVNENIAFSGWITNTEGGAVVYTNHAGGNCNKYLSTVGIETGLKEGCIDYDHMMGHLAARPNEKYGNDLEALMALLNEYKDANKPFPCATEGFEFPTE